MESPLKPAEACCTTMRGDQCSAFHRDRLWDTTYQYVHTTTTLGDNDSWPLGCFTSKIAIFKWSWQRVKVLPRPGSYLVPFRLDQTFKMRYSIPLNSHWIQKYKPSKLKKRKTIQFPYLNRHFFVFKTLTACIFESSGSSEGHCTPF